MIPDTKDLYEDMRSVENRIKVSLEDIRFIQANTSPDVLEAYGGKDYARHLSLTITKLEEALMWAGGALPDPQ